MKNKDYVTVNNPKELAKLLGLDESAAIEWKVRRTITQQIIKVFTQRNLSISDLAKISGTSRARITKILKQHSIGISLDVLVRVLGALGEDMKISFKRAA